MTERWMRTNRAPPRSTWSSDRGQPSRGATLFAVAGVAPEEQAGRRRERGNREGERRKERCDVPFASAPGISSSWWCRHPRN
jgi:hypothetical protein